MYINLDITHFLDLFQLFTMSKNGQRLYSNFSISQYAYLAWKYNKIQKIVNFSSRTELIFLEAEATLVLELQS